MFKYWLFESLELCLFELIGLFGLFVLCVFELFELFGLCAFKLCVGLGCVSCFVCARVSCFCFAFARLLLTWAPARASRHGVRWRRQKAWRSRRLLLSTGVICVLGTGVSESVRRAPGGQPPGVRVFAPA